MFGRKREDTTAMERMMWQVVKALITLLVFVVVMVLVVLPMVERKTGISLFGTSNSAQHIEIVGEPTMATSYLDGAGYYASISGTITNTHDEAVQGVKIEFDLMDENGSKIGSAVALVESIAGRGECTFEAGTLSGMNSAPQSFRLSRITGVVQ